MYNFEKITTSYPDGAHDAEAILVDNISKDIYIITKGETKSLMYKLTYPQSTTQINTASLVVNFPFGGVVSAALSPNSKEVILKPILRFITGKGLPAKP